MKQARTEDHGEDGDVKIHHIPQECLVSAISLSSPADACRAAAVSTGFRLAADSDAVWERFLPPDYDDILNPAVHLVEFDTKKELFLDLCQEHILLDDGRISFGLHRSKGAKCYMLSIREFGIAWFGTALYWREIQDPDSRFPNVAELLRVCWVYMEIHIHKTILSSCTHYAGYLVYKLTRNASGLSSPRQKSFVKLDDQVVGSIHRVSLHPCKRQSCVGNDERSATADTEPHDHEEEEAGGCIVRYPRPRTDGWMEFEMCDFRTDEALVDSIRFILLEVEELQWKTGLIIEGVEIRPKS